MQAFGFKAALFSMFGYDYKAQDYFLRQSVYRAYGDMQLQSHLNKARKEYYELKTRSNSVGNL